MQLPCTHRSTVRMVPRLKGILQEILHSSLGPCCITRSMNTSNTPTELPHVAAPNGFGEEVPQDQVELVGVVLLGLLEPLDEDWCIGQTRSLVFFVFLGKRSDPSCLLVLLFSSKNTSTHPSPSGPRGPRGPRCSARLGEALRQGAWLRWPSGLGDGFQMGLESF